MNFEKRYRYLRMVLRIIAARKWRNGLLVEDCLKAIKRSETI